MKLEKNLASRMYGHTTDGFYIKITMMAVSRGKTNSSGVAIGYVGLKSLFLANETTDKMVVFY